MDERTKTFIEYIGVLLVKEYLTSKRLVSTIRCMELEFPFKIRYSNLRLLLSEIFKIEDESSYAEETNSHQSVLEIILRDLMKKKTKDSEIGHSWRQADQCYSSKILSDTVQVPNTNFESAEVKVSTQTEFEYVFEIEASAGKRDASSTKYVKHCDLQSVKRLLQIVSTQGKSKYVNKDEENPAKDEKPLQDYGADQPKDYPKQHLQSCLRDREEILMSSLRRSPDYLNDDNSIRLGPNKVNTFQCLKSRVEHLSSNNGNTRKYERFCRIIPKVSKKLNECSLETARSGLVNEMDYEFKKEDIPLGKEGESIAITVDSLIPCTEQGGITNQPQDTHSKKLSDEQKIPINMHFPLDLDSYEEKSDVQKNNEESPVRQFAEPECLENNFNVKVNGYHVNRNERLVEFIEEGIESDCDTKNQTRKHQKDSIQCENESEDEIECMLLGEEELKNEEEFYSSNIINESINENIESSEFEPIKKRLVKKLTKLLSGRESSLDVPSRWKGQSFIFNDNTKLKYGLMQAQGGPCGVIAVVQAFLLKALLFDSQTPAVCQDPFRPTQMELKSGLVHAISEILWQAGKGEHAVLAMYESPIEEEEEEEEKEEVDDNIICRKFNNISELKSTIKEELHQFLSTEGNGCYLVAISAILSAGIESVISDMDEESNSLIVNGGSCSLELVNLLLTGNAVSNVFDNNVHIGPCLLKGISRRSNIGFLSIYEHSNACQVGSNLKTPRYPIWVVNCQNHFTVIYSENKKLISDWRAERQFNIYLYDSMSNQKEEVKLTIDTTGLYLKPRTEGEYVPPIELCLLTKWKGAAISWNGSKLM